MRKITTVIALLSIVLSGLMSYARPPLREADHSSMTKAELFEKWNNQRDLKALLAYMNRNNFPPLFRIGIVDGKEKVELCGDRPVWIHGQTGEATVEPGSTLKFVAAPGNKASVVNYKVVVKDYPIDSVQLQEDVLHWEDLGYQMDLLTLGKELKDDDGNLINDNRKTLVVAASVQSMEEAEKVKKEIQEKHGVVPYIHEALVEESKGRIHVFVDDVLCFTSGPEIKISSAGLLKVKNVDYGIGYPWQGVEDREYRGTMIAALARNGQIALVNEIRLELYLMGVVPSEISSSAASAALRVQAIAARGESLAKYGVRHSADPFDLCSEQHCQVYSGIRRETASTNGAISDTEGKILRCQNHIVDAVYSANCGGFTENAENVWTTNPRPYLVSVPDLKPGSEIPDLTIESNLREWLAKPSTAWCADPSIALGDRHRWEKRFTSTELDKMVAEKHPEVGPVKEMIPGRRGGSGRIWDLKIIGDKGETTIIKELPIRRLFGVLRSAAFVLDVEKNADGTVKTWIFRGAGWGHGVGMCQHGTMGMAKHGYSADDILSHYFKTAVVEKVY